jgi:hypothetical protein
VLYVLWFALLLTMVRVYMKTLRFHTFGKGNPAASCGEFWGLNCLEHLETYDSPTTIKP